MAQRADDSQAPAHRLGQAARDREPEADATIATRQALFALHEGLEDALFPSDLNAGALILHLDLDAAGIAASSAEGDGPFAGKLDRVVDELIERALDSTGSPMTPSSSWLSSLNWSDFSAARRVQTSLHPLYRAVPIEGLAFQGGFALDAALAEIDVVDPRQEPAGRALDLRGDLGDLLGGHAIGEDPGQADDLGERRADLRASGGWRPRRGQALGDLCGRAFCSALGQRDERGLQPPQAGQGWSAPVVAGAARVRAVINGRP